MKYFLAKLRLKPALWLLGLFGLTLLAVAFLGPRWVVSARWNLWAIQFIRQAGSASDPTSLYTTIPAGHEQALVWLARKALAKGDAQSALRLLDSPAFRNDLYAVRIRVAAMERLGNFSGALQALIVAGNFNMLIDFAELAADENDLTNAIAAYRAAWTVDNMRGALPLAYYLNSKSDLPGTETVLKKALADFPDSDQRVYWYRLLGDTLRKQKNYDVAKSIYQEAEAEYSKDVVLQIGLGWVYYEWGGHLQQAIDQFQAAIELDPIRGDGYFAMAELLRLEQRATEADHWYDLAIQHEPQNVTWYIARGNNARASGKLDLALSIYLEAARLSPDNSRIYYEMAWAYRMNGLPGEAIKAIEQALSTAETPNANYALLAGKIYESSGDTTRAEDAYRETLRLDPGNTAAQDGLNRLTSP